MGPTQCEVRPDPKRAFFPFFEYLSTQVCEDIQYFPRFLWLGRQTRHLHLSSSFRPIPKALLMCFHVICPVLRASAVSSVHTRRCSHQCSPPTTLAEDLAPISGSKQPARVLRGLEAPSRCWRSGVPRATMFNLHKVAPPLNETSLLLLGSSTYSRPPSQRNLVNLHLFLRRERHYGSFDIPHLLTSTTHGPRCFCPDLRGLV